MTKPTAKILMGVSDWVEGVFQLSFFNAETSEHFNMPLPQDVAGYFWLDSGHFAFLTKDRQIIYSVSLLTGEVTQFAAVETVAQYLAESFYNAPRALVAFGGLPTEKDFFLITALQKAYTISLNGRYFATRDTNQDGYPITVTDVGTGEIVELNSLNSGLWNMWFEWSPSNSTHLAVFQGKFSLETGELYTDRLKVYDVTSGQFIAYKDDFENQSDLRPCILDLDTAQTICIPEIAKAHLAGKYEGEGIGLTNWSADKKRVFYTYYYYGSAIEGYHFGNFCIYTLSNREISCPTDGIPELKGNTITDYAISPDGQYVVLRFECRSLGSDSACSPTGALMNLDGSGFRLLIHPELPFKQMTGTVNFLLDNYESASAYLWRPTP